MYAIFVKVCSSSRCIHFDFVDVIKACERNLYRLYVGRVLTNNLYINGRCIATHNQDITVGLANFLINLRTKPIYIRSPLTYKRMNWIYQFCYGWNLTHGDLIELGEAVGMLWACCWGFPNIPCNCASLI